MKNLKLDIFINVVSALIKGVILLLTIRFAGIMLGSVMMGIYLFARRIAITGANLLILGMAATLLRYISIYEDDRDAQKTRYVFALIGAFFVSIFLFATYYLFGDFFAELFFPNIASNKDIFFWLLVFLMATIFHYIVNVSIFAFRKIILANIAELLSAGGILLGVLLWLGKGTDALTVLRYQAFISLLFSLSVVIAFFIYLHRISRVHWENTAIIKDEFVEFGLPRGLIAFLDSGTLLVGPWLLRDNPAAAGYLIVALVMVRFLQAGIMPITQVISVVTARLTGKGEEEKITFGVRLMFGFLIYSTFFVMILVLPWLNHLLVFWLKKPIIIQGTKVFASYLIWGMIPITFFYGMRGIIEMRWKTPKNLYNLLFSLSSQIIFFLISRSYLGDEYATGLSFLVLFFSMGLLSVYFLRHDLKDLSFWKFHYLFVFLLILYILNSFIAQRVSLVFFVPVSAVAVLSALSFAYLLRKQIPFIELFLNYLLPKRFLSH